MLNDLNARLKGVSVIIRNNRFYLSAQLPPKPNAAKQFIHQQRIATGLEASHANLGEVEKMAIVLAGKLIDKTFAWPEISVKKTIERPCFKDAIESYKQFYLISGTESTWDGDYWPFLKKLPQHQQANVKPLLDLIDTTQPNSSPRKRLCAVVNGFAKFLELNIDVDSLRGNYGPKKVNPRDLPDDKTIKDWFFKIPYRPWQWVYGMMATYGLRNHEVFFIDHEYLKQTNICWVLEGKTGPGKIWPFYPEWVEEFDLKNIALPNVHGQHHRDYGMRVSQAFQRYKLPFKGYDLRHAWARRVSEMGLPSELAAKQMRHSQSVHDQTYSAWWGDDTHQKVYDAIIGNKDRMLPP